MLQLSLHFGIIERKFSLTCFYFPFIFEVEENSMFFTHLIPSDNLSLHFFFDPCLKSDVKFPAMLFKLHGG